jgi:thioredoxin reductase (NADPH)
MSKPVLMVLDDQPQSVAALEEALRSRYEHDYLIISHTSASTALNHLTELRAACRPVAVVLAAALTTETSGTEFLARVRSSQPAAKRVLIVPRGGPAAPSLRVPAPLLQDRSAALPVLQAMALGAIDTYLPGPGNARDEGFHRGVSELLEEWAHDAAPALPAAWIIGERQSARSYQLRDLLARNSIPYVFNAADSEPGRAMVEQAGQDCSALPVLVMYSGEVLVDPPIERLAAAFGLAALPSGTVDVAIVGAGPAGLSAAVYTAAEGLSTLLLEREAIGGQAGSSSLIRNYLGFPHGVTGASLATRAFEQAWSFGAVTSMTGPVTGLWPASDGYIVSLGDGGQARARTVVIATGVSYRRLTAPGVDALLGAGVFYGPPPQRPAPWPASRSTSPEQPTPLARPRSTWHGTPPR